MFHGKISLVLLLLLVSFVSEFRLELMYIPHLKYQVKPHSSRWFSAACAAAIAHRNHFFRWHQQNKSSESKVKFRQASNRCKKVLEAAKLAYANKTRVHHLPETWLLDFWRIANSPGGAISSRALILMSLLSLYPFSLLELL